MLGAAQFIVDFWGMHFNTKKALCINFQKHASIFCKEMLSIINGWGHGWCYVLPTSRCDNKNIDFPMEYRYTGLICQHSIENILNVSQRFIKLIHWPTKPHRLFGQFPNRQKVNKKGYDYIDAFLCQLKEDIGEPIVTRYVRDIIGMTTINYDN